jgi:hypothetical protein
MECKQMAQASDKDTYARFFELKEQIITLNAELKDVQGQVREMMQTQLDASGKKVVVVKSPHHDKVIQYSTSKTRATISKQFVKKTLAAYITEIGHLSADDVQGFIDYLEASRDLQTRTTTRLAYRKPKQQTALAATTILPEAKHTRVEEQEVEPILV